MTLRMNLKQESWIEESSVFEIQRLILEWKINTGVCLYTNWLASFSLFYNSHFGTHITCAEFIVFDYYAKHKPYDIIRVNRFAWLNKMIHKIDELGIGKMTHYVSVSLL